jgi:molybdate transport system substrate-binding protein
MSADGSYVSLLQQYNLTNDEGSIYGIGQLVLFIPLGSKVLPSADLSTLISGIKNGQLKRLAIANPEYAPYGMIAKQAMQNGRIWDTVFSSLAYGKSASQAVQFGLTGAVDAALIPYSLAIMPMVSSKGNFTLVSDRLYSPLQQRMVLLKNAGSAAKEFYRFMLGDKAREIFERYGFGLPTTLNYQSASQKS